MAAFMTVRVGEVSSRFAQWSSSDGELVVWAEVEVAPLLIPGAGVTVEHGNYTYTGIVTATHTRYDGQQLVVILADPPEETP